MEKSSEGRQIIETDIPSLIFLGTPDFAVPSLIKLIDSGVSIRLVVTQPDRPSGRGMKVGSPPVKIAAERLGIPVYQPLRVRGSEIIEYIRSFGAECAVVVAYGQILPQAFLDSFPLGVVNVHASLLPRHRGAAPIHRAILSGDRVTGVSIMLLDAGMDTGPVFSQREVPISEEDAFGVVHDKLAETGAGLLIETLAARGKGLLTPRPQENDAASYAPPLKKEELRVAWDQSAQRIVNTIRAFDPWPGAFGFLQGKRVKFYGASILNLSVQGEPGRIVGRNEKGLAVLAGDGQVFSIGELQMEGQRRMSADEFLRGRPMPPGSCLQ